MANNNFGLNMEGSRFSQKEKKKKKNREKIIIFNEVKIEQWKESPSFKSKLELVGLNTVFSFDDYKCSILEIKGHKNLNIIIII